MMSFATPKVKVKFAKDFRSVVRQNIYQLDLLMQQGTNPHEGQNRYRDPIYKDIRIMV